MNCFPCFSSQRSKKESSKKDENTSFDELIQPPVPGMPVGNPERTDQAEHGNVAAQTFNFRELAAATKNFRQECLLGEGGFGRVYKGTLQATGQVVAVKQLDRNAMQGNKEFLVEVGHLSLLKHPNLVNLIGYCADGDQMLLVYEFMPGGTLEDHLYGTKKAEGKTLDWITRMKIAYGAAQGLEYLHDKSNPPVIYRDLKSSNVLLDEKFNAKLSDIGLDKLGPSTEKMPMQSRVMGTYGYIAPEYSRSGRLTTIADVYSFGVVLLELITGRRAIDTTKPVDEQNLVAWAQPIFREPKKFPEMADPLLKKRFPERGLNQAVAIAAMCLQDEAAARPLMSDVVTALSFLSVSSEENSIPPTLPPSISSKLHSISTKLQFLESPESRRMSGSVVRDQADSDSESDHGDDDDENDDKRSVSSCRSSSAQEESALTHRRSTVGSGSSREESNKGGANAGNFSLSQKSSGLSLFSIGQASVKDESCRDAADLSDSLSRKSSKKSSKKSQDSSRELDLEVPSSNLKIRIMKTDENVIAHSGSSDSVDESVSSRQKRNNRKALKEEETDCSVASPKSSSRKSSTDGSVASMSRKGSRRSKEGSISSRHSSSRRVQQADGNSSSNNTNNNTSTVSLSRKSSRRSHSQQGSIRKGATTITTTSNNEESNSGSSHRKNRRRSNKKANKESLNRSSSTGGLHDESCQVEQQQHENIRPSVTFTTNKTTFF